MRSAAAGSSRWSTSAAAGTTWTGSGCCRCCRRCSRRHGGAAVFKLHPSGGLHSWRLQCLGAFALSGGRCGRQVAWAARHHGRGQQAAGPRVVGGGDGAVPSARARGGRGSRWGEGPACAGDRGRPRLLHLGAGQGAYSRAHRAPRHGSDPAADGGAVPGGGHWRGWLGCRRRRPRADVRAGGAAALVRRRPSPCERPLGASVHAPWVRMAEVHAGGHDTMERVHRGRRQRPRWRRLNDRLRRPAAVRGVGRAPGAATVSFAAPLDGAPPTARRTRQAGAVDSLRGWAGARRDEVAYDSVFVDINGNRALAAVRRQFHDAPSRCDLLRLVAGLAAAAGLTAALAAQVAEVAQMVAAELRCVPAACAGTGCVWSCLRGGMAQASAAGAEKPVPAARGCRGNAPVRFQSRCGVGFCSPPARALRQGHGAKAGQFRSVRRGRGGAG